MRSHPAISLTASSIDDARIRSIAVRATPFWDRPPGRGAPGVARHVAKVRQRLRRWREILGDAKILAKRLRGSGVSAREMLSGAGREVECPEWASTLASVLRLYADAGDGQNAALDVDRSFDPAEPMPFEDVLVGFVRHARQRFGDEAGDALGVLCESAAVDFERQLLGHLSFVASMTIGRDFYDFRFAQAPASAMESAWSRQDRSTTIYSAYVRHMRDGGLVELLDRHPVLARLLSVSIEQWARTSAAFCRRFHEDFSRLRPFFGWHLEHAEGAVAHLGTDLSDRHNGGQAVIECVLRTDERVIYKPRSVRPEAAFYRFIDRVNGCDLSLDLKAIGVLDRGTHGWVEWVPVRECGAREEVARFYRRGGMLLAVLHALAIADVHCENVIASGEQPVVVDLETLLSHDGHLTEGTGDDGASVLGSGFLPRWQEAPDGHHFDMSALGADDQQDPGITLPVWHAINTDQMTFSEQASARASMTHRACLGGGWPTVAEHLAEFLEGFKEVYACLIKRRPELIADDRLMDAFDHLELRVLVRNTATYARLHLHLLHPEHLKDGIDRSIELEWLARPLGGTPKPQAGRIRLYEAERAAMERLDVPYFSTSEWRALGHDSDDPDLLRMCGERDARALRRRLASLSPGDCARQIAVIEEAIRSRYPSA